jgi:hypothetical protein
MFFILSTALQLAIKSDLKLVNELKGRIADSFPSSIFDPEEGFDKIQDQAHLLEREGSMNVRSLDKASITVDSNNSQVKVIAKIYVSGSQAQDLLAKVMQKAIEVGGTFIFVSNMNEEGKWINFNYTIMEISRTHGSLVSLLPSFLSSRFSKDIHYNIIAMKGLSIKKSAMKLKQPES